jgi:hypothetical protein
MKRIRLVAAIVAAVAVASVFAHVDAAQAATSPTVIGTRSALDALAARSAGTRARLDRPTTLVLGRASSALPNATVARSFKSERAFEAELADGRLAGVGAVIYDPERWELTPADEQADPETWESAFARTAHAAGLRAIVAPARTLAPSKIGYLNAGLAGQAGRAFAAAGVAGTLSIQSQALQADPAGFRDFIRQARAQARVADPGIRVLAGVSQGMFKGRLTPAALAAAFHGLYVAGYWLTVNPLDPQAVAWTSAFLNARVAP